MSDGSTRLLHFANGYPIAAQHDDEYAFFNFVPGTVPYGTTREQPDGYVPFAFENVGDPSELGLQSIEASVIAVDWYWDDEYQEANYGVQIMADEIALLPRNSFVAGDSSPIKVEIKA